MIELYHYPLSPCGEKVRFCLAVKGLPWHETLIDLGRKQNLSAEYLSLNPKGFVPTLVDGPVVLAESTVINEYLDDMYPEPPLKPDSAADRARMRRWSKLVDELLHPAWPGIAWPVLVRPVWQQRSAEEVEAMLALLPDPARRDRQRRMYRLGLDAPDFGSSLATFSDVLQDMERTLTGSQWLAGERLSLADLAIFPYPFAAAAFGLDPWIRGHGSRVAEWCDRMRRQPALAALIETGFPAERMAEVARLGQGVVERLPALRSRPGSRSPESAGHP